MSIAVVWIFDPRSSSGARYLNMHTATEYYQSVTGMSYIHQFDTRSEFIPIYDSHELHWVSWLHKKLSIWCKQFNLVEKNGQSWWKFKAVCACLQERQHFAEWELLKSFCMVKYDWLLAWCNGNTQCPISKITPCQISYNLDVGLSATGKPPWYATGNPGKHIL